MFMTKPSRLEIKSGPFHQLTPHQKVPDVQRIPKKVTSVSDRQNLVIVVVFILKKGHSIYDRISYMKCSTLLILFNP